MISEWLFEKLSVWLLYQDPTRRRPSGDLELISKLIKPTDIILIAGRSRAGSIIRQITTSPWTHAALYIGCWSEIQNPKYQRLVKQLCDCDGDVPLIIETEIGLGAVISPLSKYTEERLRLMRPRGLVDDDKQRIINTAISRLGRKYSMVHLFDIARLIFPWGLSPKRWRKALFNHNALQPTKDICSTLIAYAFESVDYPVLSMNDSERMMKKSNGLFMPSDFDFSPYFDIIKYPVIPINNHIYDSFMQDQQVKINQFFESEAFGIAGASSSREKYGNRVLRCYLQHDKKIYPVHPKALSLEGVACLNSINKLPMNVKSLSIVTPPIITEKIVLQAIKHGITNIWMQPGAESALAIEVCRQHGVNLICNGPCVLIELGFDESK
jgi:predicted CoA-binding protein